MVFVCSSFWFAGLCAFKKKLPHSRESGNEDCLGHETSPKATGPKNVSFKRKPSPWLKSLKRKPSHWSQPKKERIVSQTIPREFAQETAQWPFQEEGGSERCSFFLETSIALFPPDHKRVFWFLTRDIQVQLAGHDRLVEKNRLARCFLVFRCFKQTHDELKKRALERVDEKQRRCSRRHFGERQRGHQVSKSSL